MFSLNLVQFLVITLVAVNCEKMGDPLSQMELEARYGQGMDIVHQRFMINSKLNYLIEQMDRYMVTKEVVVVIVMEIRKSVITNSKPKIITQWERKCMHPL